MPASNNKVLFRTADFLPIYFRKSPIYIRPPPGQTAGTHHGGDISGGEGGSMFGCVCGGLEGGPEFVHAHVKIKQMLNPD